MKLYYIDDSMFQKSFFSQQILSRFERYFQAHGKGIIFISSGSKDNENIEYFYDVMADTTILMSPSLFDIEGVRGNLHSTFLAVENFPLMQSYSGTFVEYDTKKHTCQRIYLEMFLHHEEDLEDIVLEMEQILNEKIQLMKKKTTLN